MSVYYCATGIVFSDDKQPLCLNCHGVKQVTGLGRLSLIVSLLLYRQVTICYSK